MKEYKSIVITCIAGLCAIICVMMASNGFVKAKLGTAGTGLSATGSASVDFDSDMGVWRGSFSVHGATSKTAYRKIMENTELVKQYFEESGVTEDELVFYSVDIAEKSREVYNSSGQYIGSVSDGYELTQSFAVSSHDVDKVSRIANECTKLIESGVEIISSSPEYYYTKLDELKLQLIEEATQNARARIDIIAENAGCEAGELLTANLGVFQITGANSGREEYSSGGTFNTSSRSKTASITVRLNYSVK